MNKVNTKKLSLNNRFNQYVMPSIDGCHYWIGATSRHGYGQFLFNGKCKLAHRVRFIMKHGYIDSSLKVCHSCDNPLCVNPDHLFLGTQMDNVRDMIKKGRKSLDYKSDRHHWYTITPEMLSTIISMRESGSTLINIAAHFNVHFSTIWKHLKKAKPRF